MKIGKFDKIAICIALLVIALYCYFGSTCMVSRTIKTKFSNEQINEICARLKFVLAPEETISVDFFPGFLQATTYIKVHIENIKSEADFLSRFRGNSVKRVPNSYNNYEAFSVYDAEIFQLEEKPKDYTCRLYFFNNESGKTGVIFLIVGYIPELINIYKFLNK